MAILDPGLNLTLRPMAYPQFFEMYKAARRNHWSVDEVDFAFDVEHLAKMTPRERHVVQRLVAFFATGDSIVANNLAVTLYKHINAPEARMYLLQQGAEEALHVQFYLTLLDTYVPDHDERAAAFDAVKSIPSIARKAEFCARHTWAIEDLKAASTADERRAVLLNLIAYAACIEGLFFFAAFAYVYFLRSKGLLHGLATGTNWVFRDESMHMAFAFEVVKVARSEEPDLIDDAAKQAITQTLKGAVDLETEFAIDLLAGGIPGLSIGDMRGYLEYIADQRAAALGLPKIYGTKNPLAFMVFQDVQEITSFFERRVSAYQVGVTGKVDLDASF